MELTKEQENTLGNFKEHINSVKKNIAVANDELEGILRARDEESSAFEYALKEHSEIMGKLRAEKEDMLNFMVSERQQLAADIRKLDADKQEFAVYKLESITAIEIGNAKMLSEKNFAEIEIASMKNSINKLSEDIHTLDGSIKKLTDEETTLKDEVYFLADCTSAAQADLKYFTEKRDEMTMLANKEIKQKQEELILLDSQILSARESIKNPRENLAKEIADFELRKTQMDIAYHQLKKLWARIYPDQDLDKVIAT